MTQREQLIARIEQLKAAYGCTRPAVSLEEFFEGNEDYGSIGCNLDKPHNKPPPSDMWVWLGRLLHPSRPIIPGSSAPHPGPQGFYKILRDIRIRPNVQDVLVEICDADVEIGPDWPFSECVYILTEANREEVAGWVAPLFPDTVEEEYQNSKPANAPELLPGCRVYEVWWD